MYSETHRTHYRPNGQLSSRSTKKKLHAEFALAGFDFCNIGNVIEKEVQKRDIFRRVLPEAYLDLLRECLPRRAGTPEHWGQYLRQERQVQVSCKSKQLPAKLPAMAPVILLSRRQIKFTGRWDRAFLNYTPCSGSPATTLLYHFQVTGDGGFRTEHFWSQ
jgi:hypothetical protein